MHCIDIDIGEESHVWNCMWDNFIQKQHSYALDSCPKCIFAQYLKNEQTNFNKILHMHWYIYVIYNYILLFLIFQPSYSPFIYVQNVFIPNIFRINSYITRKFCIDIGIAEEWCGIASGLISFRNNGVVASFVIKVQNAYQKWAQWQGILIAKAFIVFVQLGLNRQYRQLYQW